MTVKVIGNKVLEMGFSPRASGKPIRIYKSTENNRRSSSQSSKNREFSDALTCRNKFERDAEINNPFVNEIIQDWNDLYWTMHDDTCISDNLE